MKASEKLILAGLVILVGAAIAGLILTRSSSDSEAARGGRRTPSADRAPGIDRRTFETAQKLSGLAVTEEEERLAHEALRVADHEADLAFADALRVANEQPSPQTEETRAIKERIQPIESQIKANEEKVKQLTAQRALAERSERDNLQIRIELSKAESALEQDELADAKEDLIRAGGDAHSKLQRLLDEHEAMEHANETPRPNSGATGPPETVFSPDSLIANWREWSALREKQGRQQQARQDASRKAAALSQDHESVEQHVREEQAQKQELAQRAASLLKMGKTENGANSKQAAAAALSSVRHLSEDEKNLLDLDKRIQDLGQLGATYGQWSASVGSRQQASLHAVIKSAFWIVLTLLLLFFFGRSIDQLFTRVNLEHKQQITLRAIVHFTGQVLAVLVIAFVIFGSPRQMSTIVGLAGAGLTVALKDFIVSFLGWFVLMGRNGIRLGDWVEINGVTGEVVEIGLFHTVLLETGNWADSGHPTGRRVTFTNNYAIEGHYFNFSTSGQWLWDELQLVLPAGQDPYPVVREIQKKVCEATKEGARQAEQEWRRATGSREMSSFSVDPAVSVKPVVGGVEVAVRYVTKANERYRLRAELYQFAVEM